MDDPCGLDAAAETLLQTLRVARALAQAHRTFTLDGLDRQAGLLCAKVLDLAPDRGRGMRPRLMAILAEVSTLTTLLQAAEPPGTHPRQKAVSWNRPPLS